MITPLMHILSCLDEQFNVGEPANILYLSKSDRDVVIAEARRLCELVLDQDIIATDAGHVYPVQYCGDNSITLNVYTLALLERIQSCAQKYLDSLKSASKHENSDDDDLSTQATILRLEGNPDYIYYYVYKVMETPAISYEVKISKLAELLTMLNAHGGEKLGRAANDHTLMRRMELHSQLSYWKSMLMGDVMSQRNELPPEPFTEDTIVVMRKQLQSFGLYGFVNSLKMYRDFSLSRVVRKTNVNIPDRTLIFLGKVVQSGGGRVQVENDN